MLTTSDFKRGLVIQLDGAPCLILDVTFQSPSARGANTMVKTRYRNLLTSQVLDRTFRSGDKVDEADYERHKGQFLYADANGGVFMDLETYEQFEMGEEGFAALAPYLLDGTEVTLGLFEGRMVAVDLPLDRGVDRGRNGAGHQKCHCNGRDQGCRAGDRSQDQGAALSGERCQG